MTISRPSIALAITIVISNTATRAEERSIPKALTPDTFAAIKSLVDLTPKDLAWQQVRWRDGFFEGLLDAQAEDKPIFYWIYEGDPRGHC